ncbi:hypothetical protein [Piscinibacter sakaiensis]|uniref:hypothetical protein n=1 Tax=Piscinibacter sakaiensis TaxID=1547922 RepID=UPI003AAD601D
MIDQSSRPGAGPRRSGRWRWLATAALVLASAACKGPAPPAATPAAPAVALAETRIDLGGPTLVAFLPPDAQQPGVEGAAEAVAHVGFAMADTRQCLGDKPVSMTTVFADRLTINEGGNLRTIELDRLGQGIGAVLAEPGRADHIVKVEVGASSLSHLLPQAAFDYWQQAACKRD